MAKQANKTTAAKKLATKGAMVATFADPPDKVKADAMAKMALRPSVNAAVVLETYTKATLGQQDISSLVAALSARIEDVLAGDMEGAEAMLYGQAHALQAIFMNLARRAATQEYMKNWEAYLRMAMKAQSQCRMTLETLATIKNPPVVFARQANINNGGQQQVNNGATVPLAPVADTHAGFPDTAQTKLLEVGHVERLDNRAQGAAGGADPKLATMEAIHRAEER
jgi:hypothetical protein